MLRFGAAALTAAFIWLAADWYANGLFHAFGSQIGANYAYKVFGWACMSAAVLVATRGPRHWPTVLVCGLALTVAMFEARVITLFTIANGVSRNVGWFETLIVFALPLWLIWLWYKGAVSRLGAR